MNMNISMPLDSGLFPEGFKVAYRDTCDLTTTKGGKCKNAKWGERKIMPTLRFIIQRKA